MSVLDSFATLLAWWSVWTVFDIYLIPFSPYSEFTILFLSCLLFYIEKARFKRKAREIEKSPLPVVDPENGDSQISMD